MEGDDMACPCGGVYEWSKALQALVCIKCGRHSPYQRLPNYEELQKERDELLVKNEQLKADLAFYKEMWLKTAQQD